jgi:hypothetical protein
MVWNVLLVSCRREMVSGQVPWLTPGVITPSRQGGDSRILVPVTISLRQATCYVTCVATEYRII